MDLLAGTYRIGSVNLLAGSVNIGTSGFLDQDISTSSIDIDSLNNQGLIRADAPGGSLKLTTNTFINEGVAVAAGGGLLEIVLGTHFQNLGTIRANANSTVRIKGETTFANLGLVDNSQGGLFEFRGTRRR